MQKARLSVALLVAPQDYVDRLICRYTQLVRGHSAVHSGWLCSVFLWLIMALTSDKTKAYARQAPLLQSRFP
jgi:hypothetical protein